MAKSLVKLFSNLIYPPRCVFCSSRLSPKAKREVCTKCSNTLPYTRLYHRCKKCGKPASSKSEFCNRCRLTRQYNTKMTSPFIYADAAKKAVLAFKKERNSGAAKTLSVYMAEMVKYDFKNIEFDMVVSVPPRKKGQFEERYDQAAYLAKAVARNLSLPYVSGAMYQTERIRKQSTLSYHARESNVSGKFAVKNPDRFLNKTVLLVDDVCTSGSTLNECARMLKQCGAYRVYAVTLATVPAV